MPYNVLHIIGGGEIGGAEKQVFTLLKNLDPQQFRPSLACLVDGPFLEMARESQIPAQSFPMSNPLDLRPISPLTKWAKEHNIHLFHTHGSRANLLGRPGARRLGIPCVSTVHSSLAHDYLSPGAARLALFLDRLTLPLASGIITVSDALQAEVKKRGGKNIHTIYNGVDVSNIPSGGQEHLLARQKFRTLWQIPEDAFVIGSIARFHPTKGLNYLISAVKTLYPSIPGLHLLLIGDGPLLHSVENELRESSIPYTLPGYLPDAAQALPAMDLFALPSVSEGMGLVLLEAIQAQIPIIASDTGGIKELLRHGTDGLLVPPADVPALTEGLSLLIKTPALRKELAESALSRLEIFSVEKMVHEVEAFYHSLLSTR